MARNGSGTFNLLVNGWNPATNGTPATAADWQSLINDVASALTQSVSRDGQTTMTGNLPMGGNKLTGLATGIASGDALAWQQLFSQGLQQDVASAATVDLGAVNSTLVNITGTTSITSFGTNYNGPRFIRFAGVLTLTNSATLVLPGNVNITTAAGDSAIAVPLGNPATGWRVFAYQRANGNPFVDSSGNVTISGGNLRLERTSGIPSVNVYSAQATGYAPAFLTLNRTGVSLGPTPSFSSLGEIRFDGTDTNGAYMNSVMISASIGSNAPGGAPSALAFATAPSGAAAIDRLTIDTNGNIVLQNPLSKLFSVNATVGSNALTVSINPCAIDFRSNTLSNGVPVVRTIPSTINIVIPSGATLGTINGVQSDLAILAIDNAGTVEGAVVNIAGGSDLSETGLISTTALSAASNSAAVYYSSIARTNVAYRVVGIVRSTQATAGTWATAPSLIQGQGGQALAAMSSLGYGQTWQDLTGSRVLGTTYYNTTGKPICLRLVQNVAAGVSDYYSISINGGAALPLMNNILVSGVVFGSGFTIIPVGASYVVTASAGFTRTWLELR